MPDPDWPRTGTRSDVIADIFSRPGPSRYRGKFTNWDSRASVRTKPRRSLVRADWPGDVFFPPEFLPVLAHPLVAAQGTATRNRLLVHSLYQYLNFTTVLEQRHVLPVTAQLSAGISGLHLPPEMRRDAFKITTDEAWHGQFSFEFIMHVAQLTGIPPSALIEPCFVRRLAEVRDKFQPSMRPLADVFFVIVSETLISGLLTGIPKDKRLPAAVRHLIGDHAADEGRHNAYFRSLLGFIWPRLLTDERHLIGPEVPGLVRIFLAHDERATARMLCVAGFEQHEAAEIVADCYRRRDPPYGLGTAARDTLLAFQIVDALDDEVVREAFASASLLPVAGGR